MNSQNSNPDILPPPRRPSAMEVDLRLLDQNVKTIQTHVGSSKILAVVKSNAYGHGLVPCAEQFIKSGVTYLGVALIEEAIELRKAGITAPILVFGGIVSEQIRIYLDYNIDLTASSVSKLQAIDAAAKAFGEKARVHLKIDTGMERIGVHYYSAQSLLEESLKCPHCDIVGIFSHFATADDERSNFYQIQLERFLEVTRFFERRSLPIPLRHIANSSGLIRSKDTHLDMVRPGIALYGVYPEPWLEKLLTVKPVMKLASRVVYFKVVKRGAGVSYGHTWIAPEDTRVVTVTIGYGDGFTRRLSNRGSVLIRGKRYPIIGNICMDQMMVDIGKDEAYNGDEVVLIGEQGNQRISAEELARTAETIPYEIMTSLNIRIPRMYRE